MPPPDRAATSPGSRGVAHRADIEGLRAVAVLGVLVFHLTPRLAPGGFIGVDVFFVISGFLITGIILRELGQHDFSFARFYARRMRRLLPAYFIMLLACFIAGFFLLLPQEFARFAVSSVFSNFYISNFYFMNFDGYFNPASETSPLLHTWSLSIEEQFYIAFPLVLLLIYRVTQNLTVPLLFMALASFVASVVIIRFSTAMAFFSPLPRFWELLLGALIAVQVVHRRDVLTGALDRYPFTRDLLALSGLAAIGLGYLAFSRWMDFPGWAVLVPTLGAAAVIVAGVGGTGRLTALLLANPLALFIGGLSYSLYLWHWPIATFYRVTYGPTGPVEELALLVACFAAAYLSFHLVETPIRRRPARPARIFPAAAAGTTCTLAIAVAVTGLNGLPQRFSREQAAIAEHQRHLVPTDDPRCFLFDAHHHDASYYDTAACLAADGEGPRVAFVGDSHAEHYVAGARKVWPQATVVLIGATGCRPTILTDGAPVCLDLMDKAFDELLPGGGFDHIFLAGRWEMHDLHGLRPTILHLNKLGAEVVVLGRVIEYENSLPRLLALEMIDRTPQAFDAWSRLDDMRRLDAEMARLLAGTNARFVSTLDLMCDDATCQLFAADNVPMQWDNSHLTADGAAVLLARMQDRGLFELRRTVTFGDAAAGARP